MRVNNDNTVTMWTVYRTGYVPATDIAGPKILVMNLETQKGRHQAWNYEFGGGEKQHEEAVWSAAEGDIVRIERGGEWSKGYYFVVERKEPA